MPSKKVIILKSHLSQKGGIEKYTLRTASAFFDKGCQVTILTTGYLENEKQYPFEIINLGKRLKLTWLHLWQFDKKCQEWLRAHPADIVFGMDRNRFQTHYRAGNGVHAEFLEKRKQTDGWLKRISFSLNPMHRYILSLEKNTYESPDLRCLFTNSFMVKNEVLKHYQTAENKVQVIHNGVEWKELEEDFSNWREKRPQLMKEYGLNPDAFQFLFIGNGYQRKGLTYLLYGLSQLFHCDFQLSVIGKEKKIDSFKELTRKLGLKDRVKFFGKRTDVRRFYQIADALVIPSTYDPFANVTVEALAMGLFVVSSKYNGASEILTSKTGIVIEDLFDVGSLKYTLQQAYQHKKTFSSAKGIRSAVEHLDFPNQMSKMVGLALEN